MAEDTDDTGRRTADKLRADRRRDNRTVLLVLLAAAALFLATSFGVALLVVYGPY